MAILIQKMLNGEKGGVIFTVNPVTQDHSSCIVESLNSPKGVVSGNARPNYYVIDKNSCEIKENIRGDIDSDELTEDEIFQLINVAKKIEARYGHPQDIEWIIQEGVVFILQSRNITNLKE